MILIEDLKPPNHATSKKVKFTMNVSVKCHSSDTPFVARTVILFCAEHSLRDKPTGKSTENRYPQARWVVPGPIDPSRKEKSFTFSWQFVRRTTESFLFLRLRDWTLFIHDLPSTHWSHLRTRNWFSTNSLVRCIQSGIGFAWIKCILIDYIYVFG